MKIRYYGFLSPGSKQDLGQLAVLVRMAYPDMPLRASKPGKLPLPEPLRCHACRSVLILACIVTGNRVVPVGEDLAPQRE